MTKVSRRRLKFFLTKLNPDFFSPEKIFPTSFPLRTLYQFFFSNIFLLSLISYSIQASDDGLCPIFKNGSPIEKLVLSGNPKLTDRCVFTMASHLPNTLTSLFISGCTRISKQAVRYLKVSNSEVKPARLDNEIERYSRSRIKTLVLSWFRW